MKKFIVLFAVFILFSCSDVKIEKSNNNYNNVSDTGVELEENQSDTGVIEKNDINSLLKEKLIKKLDLEKSKIIVKDININSINELLPTTFLDSNILIESTNANECHSLGCNEYLEFGLKLNNEHAFGGYIMHFYTSPSTYMKYLDSDNEFINEYEYRGIKITNYDQNRGTRKMIIFKIGNYHLNIIYDNEEEKKLNSEKFMMEIIDNL